MPKIKCESAKLRSFVKEFGEELFSTDGEILFCRVCEVKVTSGKQFNVQQHCDTAKHKNNVNRQSSHQSRQRLLFETIKTTPSSKSSDFSKDLCEMVASANIANNVHFRSFLEKYTTHLIADESTLRKNYLPLCYENKLQKIRSMVEENKIDETPDACRRSIANVVIGMLFASDIFLLDSQVLDAVNNFTIAMRLL